MVSRRAARFNLRSFWLGIPAAILLVIPFITLALITPWHGFHLAYGDGQAIGVSLLLSAVALPLIVLAGLPLAFWLARSRCRWRALVEIIILIPLLTPPLAMGILLVSAYGPYSSIGEALTAVGLQLNNNPGAFVLAQIYAGLPWFVMSARTAFEAVPRDTEEMGETLGASAWQIFWRLTLPQASRGLAAALAIAWVRIIGEFGIVLVFSYFPQGIPVKLFINLQNDGVEAVYTLLWVLLAATLPLPLWFAMRARKLSHQA